MINPTPLHAISAPERLPGRRLDSWKEIAAYLNRTVRTAQRWERTNGLPVHRHEQQKRGSVYAFTSELDGWWNTSQAQLEHEERQPAGRILWREVAALRFRPGMGRILLASGALILAALLIAGWWIYRSSGRTALPFASRDWVMVTDFDNQTGEAVFDRSLLAAFLVSLQQSQHVNVVPRTRAGEALKRMGKNVETRIDEATGREICLRENIRGLIICSIAKVGRGYILTARLSDPRTAGPGNPA